VGWYLRKSLGFGPLRINLSKSGLGGSVGVKGLRVGTGPRGRYLHAGRGGLYYRTSLDPPATDLSELVADSGEASQNIQAGQLRGTTANVPLPATPQPAAVPARNQLGMRLLRGLFGRLTGR
jgi:hypothetical protein